MSVLFPSSAKQSAQSELILAYDGSERMEAIGWNHRSQHRMFVACESLRWTCQKFPSVENAQIGELLWGSQHGLSLMLTCGLPQCYCGFKTQWIGQDWFYRGAELLRLTAIFGGDGNYVTGNHRISGVGREP